MSLIETIDLHNVKGSSLGGTREDKSQVNLHLRLGRVLNKNAAQCRFVLVATGLAPAFALVPAELALRVAQRRPARDTSLRTGVPDHSGNAAKGHLHAN